jgi:hypothetical protein
MTDINQLIQSGSAHAWLYVPIAILLGALHGMEPGHSKTMMAAFIIAVRGTVWQAVLLGLSAAISHSLLIWLLAATGPALRRPVERGAHGALLPSRLRRDDLSRSAFWMYHPHPPRSRGSPRARSPRRTRPRPHA